MRAIVIGSLMTLTYVLQVTIFQHIRIGGISPNFLVMIVVSFALLRGSKEGALIGLFGGLLYDINFSLTIGSAMFSYTTLGYVCGKLHPYCYRENFILPFACTVVGSLYISVMNLLGYILRGKLAFGFFLRSIIIPELIYTITLTLIVYQIAYGVNYRLESNERRFRTMF
ncbi:MAG: rod shape-determining protein MreD [Epulopiscium sp. Nele67-Bin001]|nr:MAG: rod shape-determining protein MreD [Epulopiscium sp. Nuni2H_MBin001]OON94296.1 MAG: rod shape-determining protein MreD [Epulopiscium sp. Nele67-Bin001]